jgi:gamma-glutamyl:cysteine ligase YbdK (ATP-grasp superfamily)
LGIEISRTTFTPADFERFTSRLNAETGLLREHVAKKQYAEDAYVAGFELEAWLLDRHSLPYPINDEYLERLGSPLVVPELSKFNVELNCTPQPLRAGALQRLETELNATWDRCLQTARDLEGSIVAIGTLPTIRERDLCLANISPLNRYYALNEQILKSRGGRPLRIRIDGRESLALDHKDVMLEAAATSFQVHLQVPAAQIVRHYNASVILSAPLVAATANSPFLLGRDLWDETRIPLFEQSVDAGDPTEDRRHRVTFGRRYLEASPVEYYDENLREFPVLLPMTYDDAPEAMRHLQLHNGTIWRWNRLLLGLNADKAPQFRIEHRVMPAGPTMIDMIANAALYIGAAHHLACSDRAPESALDYQDARTNFYAAARHGLSAELKWPGGVRTDARTLLLDEILPMARAGLGDLGMDEDERDRYLDLIAARVRSGQNGAAWQRAHAARHGNDYERLVADYLAHQRSAMPVHEWEI